MKRLLGYLKHTQDYALHYTEYPTVLEGYCDANWITTLRTQNQQVDMYSHLVGRQCLGNHPKKLVLLDPLWNQNLLLWIKPVKKSIGFKIS